MNEAILFDLKKHSENIKIKNNARKKKTNLTNHHSHLNSILIHFLSIIHIILKFLDLFLAISSLPCCLQLFVQYPDYSIMVSNNYASILLTKNCNNSLTTICLSWNKKNINAKESNGHLLILAWICNYVLT